MEAKTPLRGRALAAWAATFLGAGRAAHEVASPAAWAQLATAAREGHPVHLTAVCLALAEAADSQASPPALPSLLGSILAGLQRTGGRLPSLESASVAAVAAARRAAAPAAPEEWLELAASLLALLAAAAVAQASTWKTCSLLVTSVLAPLLSARAALASKPGAAPLVCGIDSALRVGLFPPGSFGSHQSAVAHASRLLGPEQPAPPPAKKRKTDTDDGQATTVPPTAALYSLVATRCTAGDAGFLSLLPWLIRCYADGRTQPGKASGPQDGFALVSFLLHAVGQAQAAASSANDAPAWCLAADAGAQLITQARLSDCCVVAENAAVLPTLRTHGAATLAQASGLVSPAVAAAAAGVADALLEVDIRLAAEPEQLWATLCAGFEAAPLSMPRFACALVEAFGDTRRLPELLSSTVQALLKHPEQQGCALLTLPLVSTAWRTAAARLPPLQAPEVIDTVRACLGMAAVWSAEVQQCECLPCWAALAETMAAVISGLHAIPASAPALAVQLSELAQYASSLLDELLPKASTTSSTQCMAALLLRVCSAVASLAMACSACTSSLGECSAHAERCLAAPLGALAKLAVVLNSRHEMMPVLQLVTCACAVQLLTLAEDSVSPAPLAAMDVLREASLRHFLQSSSPILSWDGVAATVCNDTLPCALWQLAAENMAVWATCLPTDSLKNMLAMLVRSAAGQCDVAEANPALVTPRMCSRQLLEDADFFELHCARGLLPGVLVSEVLARRLALTAGDSSQRGSLRTLAAKARKGLTEKAAAKAADGPGNMAISAAMSLVALIGRIPPEYFCDAPTLSALHSELAAFEEEAFSLLLAQYSAEGCHTACAVLCAVRRTIAHLLTIGGEACWCSPPRTSWLVASLEQLAHLASSLADEAQLLWHAVLEAADVTGKLMEVIAGVATSDQAGAMVDAASLGSAKLEDLVAAHCEAALAAPAFVPRAVSLAKGARQSGARMLAPIFVKVMLMSTTMQAGMTAADSIPMQRWDHMPAPMLRAVGALLSSASGVVQRSLLLQRFSLAAATALQATGGMGMGAPELHHLACRAAHHATGLRDGHAAPLSLAREATRLLVDRGALEANCCMRLLSLYLVLLEAETTPPALVLDAFAALAASEHAQLLADTLIVAAHDGRSAGPALRLLRGLLPMLPRAPAACIAEQALSVALLYCYDISGPAGPVAGDLAAVALGVLSVLLATRSTFLLRASSIAQAVQSPALLFCASSPLASGLLSPGCSHAFVGCCDMLSTAMRSHPHELQRCMPLVTASVRALTTALLRGLASGAHLGVPDLACATALGALFETAAGQGGAHGKYCAYLVADYLTASASLRLDVASHALVPQLAGGLHRLVDQCTAFELQQLHVTLSAGLGGVRQTALAQLVEARDKSKYAGKV